MRDRAGDTRALGISQIACGDEAKVKMCGSRTCSLNHFYPADCRECHPKPAAGIRTTSTGSAFVSAWRFVHTQSNMQQATCCMCHKGTTGQTTGCRP